jgi:hypothetical protein
MSCPFYGRAAASTWGIIDTVGNQCAIIIDAHAPCAMEALLNVPPDAKACPLLRAARQSRERAQEYLRLRNEWERGESV